MDEGKRRGPFGRRGPLRSFALGGLVGAAGTIATVRRLRRSQGLRATAGLAAFEDAPCFLELTEGERHAGRDAGDEPGE
jgi:hypothetical protein